MRCFSVFVLLSALAGAAFCQSDRGTITGTVSDPAGAVVANATVEAKNSESGATFQAGTSSTGNYTLAQLPVGTYELSVTSAGFKKYLRPGILVGVAATVRVDATLEVGSTTESVTIQAEAPLLKTESGELSHNIDYNRVDEIPLLTLGTPGVLGNVRNPLQVVSLLPGAAFANENTLRINGMPSSSQAIRIEGQDATNGFWKEVNQNVQGSVDAIQEVAIQTSNYSAEYGQAGGGYFNYTMKSGTNQFHGSAYDYFDNEALNAGLPFTNNGNGGHIRNAVRRNDYGFTLGGPVRIPKVYNGHDRTFFFFNFEQYRENLVTRSGIATVPTAAYRSGNFSGAQIAPLTVGGQPLVDSLGQTLIQNEIFDPNSTRTGPDGIAVRTPYPNAQIPMSQMDPVALKIQNMFPLPNLAGFANNYAIPAYSNFRHTTIPSVKLDHSLSSAIKISGYWQQTHTQSPSANGFSPSQYPWSSPEPTDTTNNTGRINYDHTISPTMLLHLGIGLFYTDQPAVPPSYDQTQLGSGFAPFYINQFPNIGGAIDSTIAPVRGGVGLPTNIGGVGNTFAVLSLKDVKPTANANFTWVKANHTYKLGGEMVIEGFPQVNYTRANGQFGFGQNQTGDPWEFQKGAAFSTGFAYASFLVGAPNSLTVSQVTDSRIGNHSLGFYAQDSWKVSRRFTLDYGLRYDYVTLLREEHGRMQSASFTTPNPLAGGRLGDVIYEATCGCRFNHNYPYAFGPRVGAAYQLNEKTVLRVGGGLSYSTAPDNAYLSYSVPDFYTFTSAPGSYAAVTPLQGGNPFASGNPYGNAPIKWPDFSPHYPVPFNGATIPSSPFIYIDPHASRPPRILQWSVGLQRQLSGNLVVEASYVGNRGAYWTAPVLADQAYNAITPQYLKQNFGLDITNSTDRNLLALPINSPAVIARFPWLANPNNVYPGFPKNQPLEQALRPFPQWNSGVPPFLGPPLGDTWYDALQSKVTKRYSHGLDVQAAFTWQKELALGANSNTSYLTPSGAAGGGSGSPVNDVFNYKQDKYLSGFSRPFLLVISANYTTQKINATSGAMKAFSWLARDWVLGTVLRYQSGALIPVARSNNSLLSQLDRGASNNPAVWGGGSTFQNVVPGQPLFSVDPNCHCFDPQKALVLNPNAFTDAPLGQFGTAAAFYNNYRWQRQPGESISLGRTFRFKEKANLNIRAEFYNMFNRVFLSAPSSTNPQASTTNGANGLLTGGYGYINTVNGVGTSPRTGQLVARFQF